MFGIINKQIYGSTQNTITGDLTISGSITAGTINTVTSTQLGYLSGVTSNIQTQLNNTATLNNTGFTGNTTCSAVTVSGNVSVGGALSVSGNITIAGNITASKFGNATSAEVGYLSGVTSSVQTQITNLLTSPTFTGTTTFNAIKASSINSQGLTLYEISTTGLIQCPTPIPLYIYANTTTGMTLVLPNPLYDGFSPTLVPNGTLVNFFGNVDFTINGSYTITGSYIKDGATTYATRTVTANPASMYKLLYYNGLWIRV